MWLCPGFASAAKSDSLSNTVQDAVGLLCHRITTLAHDQHVDYQYLKILLKKSAFQELQVRQPAICIGVWGNLSPVQDLAFPFTELREIPVSPFLQCVEILLNISGFKKEITFLNTEINLF